jgi:hypothetical protein
MPADIKLPKNKMTKAAKPGMDIHQLLQESRVTKDDVVLDKRIEKAEENQLLVQAAEENPQELVSLENSEAA